MAGCGRRCRELRVWKAEEGAVLTILLTVLEDVRDSCVITGDDLRKIIGVEHVEKRLK